MELKYHKRFVGRDTAGFGYQNRTYQARETVFRRDMQTPRRELKIRRAAEYF